MKAPRFWSPDCPKTGLERALYAAASDSAHSALNSYGVLIAHLSSLPLQEVVTFALYLSFLQGIGRDSKLRGHSAIKMLVLPSAGLLAVSVCCLGSTICDLKLDGGKSPAIWTVALCSKYIWRAWGWGGSTVAHCLLCQSVLWNVAVLQSLELRNLQWWRQIQSLNSVEGNFLSHSMYLEP